MVFSSELSLALESLIAQLAPHSVLTVGEVARGLVIAQNPTTLLSLPTPIHTEILESLHAVDLAIISGLTEHTPVLEGQEFLGRLKNQFAPQILLISETQLASDQGWQLADFLALGFRRSLWDAQCDVMTYQIASYQLDKDWLNARYWANPQHFDKYRW